MACQRFNITIGVFFRIACYKDRRAASELNVNKFALHRKFNGLVKDEMSLSVFFLESPQGPPGSFGIEYC
jgi:hypothetical protein